MPYFAGLFTSDPTDAGTGTEVSGGSYARQVLSVTTASAGIVTSSGDVTFPQATATWGTISHIGILDALTSGNLLMHTALTTSNFPCQITNHSNILYTPSGFVLYKEYQIQYMDMRTR